MSTNLFLSNNFQFLNYQNVIVDFVEFLFLFEYLIEFDDNYPVKAAKQNYEKAQKDFQDFIASEEDNNEKEEELKNNVNVLYKIFIKTLAEEL